MTKEELIAQRETINNLIKIESEKQIKYNKKASSLLMIGLLLITLALVDNNINYLQYVFTQNANQFVDGLMIGTGIVFNIGGIYELGKHTRKLKEKAKVLNKTK